MKSLIVALLAVFTLVTSMLSPAPALALTSPRVSLTSPPSLAVVLMAKTADAKAKEVKGAAVSSTATGAKGSKGAESAKGDAALKFGNKIADKAS